MIIELLMLGMVQAATDPQTIDPGYKITREESRLEVPREIGIIIVPYLQCLGQQINENSGLDTGAAVLKAQADAVEKCAAVKAETRDKALQSLAQQNFPSDERESFVDNALTKLEHSHDSVAARLDQANAKVKK